MSDLVGNPEDRFPQNEAYLTYFIKFVPHSNFLARILTGSAEGILGKVVAEAGNFSTAYCGPVTSDVHSTAEMDPEIQ